ncbi:MAG: hypothetical protein GTN36_06375, partial [Candidatus Aenigmarchaeota archaeon]|nr:hypothetical protein [Candidatus Aenigmarchaeota archaeon]
GPESGRPTEPEWGQGGTASFSALDFTAERIFTSAPGSYDLSEIACLISVDIYNDFKLNGESGARTSSVCGLKGIPWNYWSTGYEGCLIGQGAFSYSTSTNPANEGDFAAHANTLYHDCHICKEDPAPVAGGAGINDLDETCINLNLRDRMVGSDYFCHGAGGWGSGTNAGFLDGTGKISEFGNCVDGDDTQFNNNIGDWRGYSDGYQDIFGYQDCGNEGGATDGTADPDFCDNNHDMITWTGNQETWLGDWKVKDTATGTTNSKPLTDGRKYFYGIFWIKADKRYDVVFVLIPNENAFNADFREIWEDLLDKDDKFYRVNPLGNEIWQARTVANYRVNLVTDTSIVQTIMDLISKEAEISMENIECRPCGDGNPATDDWEDCRPDAWTVERQCEMSPHDEHFLKMPIKIKTNATNAVALGTCGVKIQGGKTYRVIVNNWWNKHRRCIDWTCGYGTGPWHNCFTGVDRSVIILEL